ncbi:hypothetical protein FRB99_007708 [Tulasnella sp. 403]|nr:hypothetical protein FRB99_007708 [Tulasnella sp. 403]
MFRKVAQSILFRKLRVAPGHFTTVMQALMGNSNLRVKYLTFDGLPDDEETHVMSRITELTANSLTHLLLSFPSRDLYYSEEGEALHDALRLASGLEEVICPYGELYFLGWHSGPALWPTWQQLRRLAIYNVELFEPVVIGALRQMPNLERFCVLNPRMAAEQGDDQGLARLIAETTPTLLFLDAEDWGNDETDNDYLPFAKPDIRNRLFLRTAIEHPGRFKIVDVDELSDPNLETRDLDTEPSEWLAKVAESGKLWDLEAYAIPTATAQVWLDTPDPPGSPFSVGLVSAGYESGSA